MKPLQFAIVKELVGEDAPALALGDDYIVADGMGGTGGAMTRFANDEATVHMFVRTLLKDFTPVKEVAPKEQEDPAEPIEETQEENTAPVEIKPESTSEPPLADDPELADYLRLIVSEIFAAEPGQTEIQRTEAFIGSRVVALRYAFALRHDLKTKARLPLPRPKDFFSAEKCAEISDFIMLGLKELVECPMLEVPAPTNALQAYLPSTLASVSIRQEEDGRFLADVISAGDSRVYAYSRFGLLQLSKDDEDETGMMFNYFQYNPEKKIRLNHRSYLFTGPVAFFACSDGCFDPFGSIEAIGVARTFFGEEKKYPASMEAWGEEVIARYLDGFQGDDISIAMGVYGTENFHDLFDSYFELHAKEGTDLFRLYMQYSTIINALSKGESNAEEKDEYIAKRVPTIYPTRLVPFLLDCIHGAKQDWVYTAELDEFIRKSIPKSRRFTPEETRKVQLEALKIAALRNDPRFQIKNTPIGRPLIVQFKLLKQITWDIKFGKKTLKDFMLAFEEFCALLDGIPDLSEAFHGKLLRDLDKSDGIVVITPEEIDASYEPFLKANATKIVPFIVDVLEANPDKTSQIDVYFSPALMDRCRKNLMVRNGKFPEELNELPEKIRQKEEFAVSYLK